MGTGELGKWAWIIGLALAVLGGILSAFGTDLGSTIGDVAVLLAFLGGVLHLASGDRTAYFIAAIALGTFAGAAGGWLSAASTIPRSGRSVVVGRGSCSEKKVWRPTNIAASPSRRMAPGSPPSCGERCGAFPSRGMAEKVSSGLPSTRARRSGFASPSSRSTR